jgi:hypothetical protein
VKSSAVSVSRLFSRSRPRARVELFMAILLTTADRKIHDLQGKIDEARNEKSRWENTARQAEQHIKTKGSFQLA